MFQGTERRRLLKGEAPLTAAGDDDLMLRRWSASASPRPVPDPRPVTRTVCPLTIMVGVRSVQVRPSPARSRAARNVPTADTAASAADVLPTPEAKP